MGLQFLTQDNFSLENGGQKMICDIDGPCIVMFKSETCGHCRTFLPVFTKLANRDSNLTFACINVEQNPKVVRMAKGTKTPIVAVPYFVMYLNGRPYSVYKGKKQPQPFMAFINKMMSKIEESSSIPSGIARGYTNDNTPLRTATFGGRPDDDGPPQRRPIDNEPGRPKLPDGVTKIPHNKAWLGDMNRR